MLERIWSGWRAGYVGGDRPAPDSPDGSPFTQILESGEPDEATHIVHRGELVFAILNIHPYTTGHLLVLPYREVPDLSDLTSAETTEIWSTVTDAVAAVRVAYRPDGLNVGLNLGRPAGGSVPSHLHVHVVPRWTGDSNFMSSIANTQTLPESLESSAGAPPRHLADLNRSSDEDSENVARRADRRSTCRRSLVSMSDEIRDELPDDLNPAGFVGAYMFPDNSRRRWPGAIYLVAAALCLVVRFGFPDAAVVNDGWTVAAAILGAAGVFSITSGWRMNVDEKEALVKAQQAVGFAVGHASAQQVWRGFRSRPTWRVFCYSAEEPPQDRGLVLVDALDGSIVEQLVEPNPD